MRPRPEKASPSRIALWFGVSVMLAISAFKLDAIEARLRSVVHLGEGVARHMEAAEIVWESVDPADEGVDGSVLDAIRDDLEEHETAVFLVVRGNRIVYEWYAWDCGPNRRIGAAAMTKSPVGSMALLVALTDGRIGLEEPAWKYIPEWKRDPVRSQIRVRDLAFHTSGLDDVDFSAGVRGELTGWKKDYFDHPDERFARAIREAPVLFPPGSRTRYSGVGFYALAYALTAALDGAPQENLAAVLRRRITRPLGIPDDAWNLSYGQAYDLDGRTGYALGSGASFTGRAVARIGQLTLDRGRRGDRALFDGRFLDELLAAGHARDAASAPDGPEPLLGGGWWLNANGAWPSVPRDAFAGFGAGHECVLVVPSLDLVAVRLGKSMSVGSEPFLTPLRQRLFEPLMRAVVPQAGTSARVAARRTGRG